MRGRCMRALQLDGGRGLAVHCGAHALSGQRRPRLQASKQQAQAGKQEAAASLVVWNAVCAKSEGPTASGREWKSSNEDPGLPLFLFQCKARSAQMETANVHCAARRRAPEAEGCLACGKLGIVHGHREPPPGPPGPPGGKERMVCSAVSATLPASLPYLHDHQV